MMKRIVYSHAVAYDGSQAAAEAAKRAAIEAAAATAETEAAFQWKIAKATPAGLTSKRLDMANKAKAFTFEEVPSQSACTALELWLLPKVAFANPQHAMPYDPALLARVVAQLAREAAATKLQAIWVGRRVRVQQSRLSKEEGEKLWCSTQRALTISARLKAASCRRPG